MILDHQPSISPEQAEAFAESLFGVHGVASPLPSDRDQNYALKSADGRRFILKISNSMASIERVLFENRVIRTAGNVLGPARAPSLLQSTHASDVAEIQFEGRLHQVRMLTWVDGTPLAVFRPHTPGLFAEIGKWLGHLNSALGSLTESGGTTSPEWDLRRAGATLASYRHFVTDPGRLGIIDSHLERFASQTQARLPDLPQQVVFNDANDHNILVSVDEKGNPCLAGLIDYGDAAVSYRVADLAIASAYGMMEKDDPLGAACSLVTGFQLACPLLETEADVLFDLICMRLCVSVALSATRSFAEPDNEYVTISEGPAWALLEQLDSIHPNLARYRLRDACAFEPNPTSAQLRYWLGRDAHQFASICDENLNSARLNVLDLSPGSLDSICQADEPKATKLLFERLAAENSVAGIGQYDEPRLVYDTPQFEIDTWTSRQNRTIHLGIDVFQEAGRPIRAPLAGIVHRLIDRSLSKGFGVLVILEHSPPGCPPFYTMYGHLSRDSVALHKVGDTLSPGALVGYIGTPAENGGWTPHVHFQVVTDLLGVEGEFNGVAPSDQRAVWLSICPDPNLILRIPTDSLSMPRLNKQEIIQKRAALLGPSLSVSYDDPLHIVRGIGTRLYDANGRGYLDCVNNVCHVGHGHPTVVKAAADQMRVLNTNTRYLHENLVRYAEELTATLPDPLDTCFFVNSGSEANDLAIRIATQHTGRSGSVVLEGAYHGNLSSLVRISPYKFDGRGGGGRTEGVYVAPMPDVYRGVHRGRDAAQRYADAVSACIREARDSKGAAAFLFESILGCGGQVEPPAGYFQKACAFAREEGVLCIADEVQVGFGRLGDSFWGFEGHGIIPDIVTMGKPIGNGHPLGAVVTTRAIARSFANGMEYFNTYGGNPVSCAVGLAVLKVIKDEGLQEQARTVGGRLKRMLSELSDRHAAIGDVRGKGLFLGIDLVRDRGSREPAPIKARYLANRARDLGVLLSTDGPQNNVIKIKPPIVFTDADADELVGVVDRVLAEDPALG